MATLDPERGSLDVVVALVGSRDRQIAFLEGVRSKVGGSTNLANDPWLQLSLGQLRELQMRIHLSAYEAELARADGAIVLVQAGEPLDPELLPEVRVAVLPSGPRVPLPRALSGAVVVQVNYTTGAGMMDALKAVMRPVLERVSGSELEPMPWVVREGFHRHDKAPAPALWPEGRPEPGQFVKVQMNLREPLECAAYPGELSGWLAMGGRVVEVLGPDEVRVTLAASTDRAPKAFDGPWRGKLRRVSGWQLPWLLVGLEKLAN